MWQQRSVQACCEQNKDSKDRRGNKGLSKHAVNCEQCLWGVLPMDMRTPALMSMGSTPHDIGDPMSMGKRRYWCHLAIGISHQTGRQLTLSWVLAFALHCLRAVGGERCDMAKTDTPARLHCKARIDESHMRQESPFGSVQSLVESPQRVYTRSC